MKDNFSGHAKEYAQYRPTYPPGLFEFLYRHVNAFEQAWDAGTGNGQVAKVLAQKFNKVLATDISEKQLGHAVQASNIQYLKAAEEIPDIAGDSVDLITVAQAIHWFSREKFYAEVKRVARERALFAALCYKLIQVNNDVINGLINHFYSKTIGAYWDKERRLVDEEYKTISFPFDEIAAPVLSIKVSWSAEHLRGYLFSWSAVQHFIKANQFNPVDELMKKIEPLWGAEQTAEFPIYMRVGIVTK